MTLSECTHEFTGLTLTLLPPSLPLPLSLSLCSTTHGLYTLHSFHLLPLTHKHTHSLSLPPPSLPQLNDASLLTLTCISSMKPTPWLILLLNQDTVLIFYQSENNFSVFFIPIVIFVRKRIIFFMLNTLF